MNFSLEVLHSTTDELKKKNLQNSHAVLERDQSLLTLETAPTTPSELG